MERVKSAGRVHALFPVSAPGFGLQPGARVVSTLWKQCLLGGRERQRVDPERLTARWRSQLPPGQVLFPPKAKPGLP
jgi:hypothetical protein